MANKVLTRRLALTLGTAGLLSACTREPDNITGLINTSLNRNAGIAKSELLIYLKKGFTGKRTADIKGTITFEEDVSSRLDEAFKEVLKHVSQQTISYTSAEGGKVEVLAKVGDTVKSSNDFNNNQVLELTKVKDI